MIHLYDLIKYSLNLCQLFKKIKLWIKRLLNIFFIITLITTLFHGNISNNSLKYSDL